MRLKGGHTAKDPRLGRVPQYDRRSTQYPVRQLALPTGLVGRSWPIPIRVDQGQTPRCVGYSAAQELATYPVAVKITASLADTIYTTAQQLDEWPGSAYDGTSVLAGAKALQQMGFINAYYWAESIDDILQVVSRVGPVVIGINWYESMFDPRPSGLLEVDESSGIAGGHAIEIRGLLLKPQLSGESLLKEPVCRLAQSWGRDWGVLGDCFVKVSDVEKLVFGGDGEAVVYLGERLI